MEFGGLPFFLTNFATGEWHTAVWDHKTSKFFVSRKEESMAGHVGVNEVY
jgi:hypothetical protein